MIFEQIDLQTRRAGGHRPPLQICRDADTARPARNRVFLFSLLWAATFLIPSLSWAAGDQSGNAALGSWITQFAAVAVLFLAMLRIYDYFRPKPPLHQQFAAFAHQHSDSMTDADLQELRKCQSRDILTIRQEMGGFTAKVERQIDYMRDALTTQNQQMMSAIKELDEKQETRIRRVHDRLDPLPAAIAANTRSIETHLADHRAGKD